MKSSSSEDVRPAPFGGELRTGTWTRLGDSAVLGDRVTEQMLTGIAERARSAAQAQGYATGWAEGRQAADRRARAELAELTAEHERRDAERQSEHEAAMEALRVAVDRVRAVTSMLASKIERQATGLAFQLTETILGRELALAGDPGADAVRRALQLLPGEGLVTVRMNPEDVRSADLEALAAQDVSVVADPSLARADVVVTADDHVVDGRVDAALDRVREVLGL
jgi:flagellar assembly protein FliH